MGQFIFTYIVVLLILFFICRELVSWYPIFKKYINLKSKRTLLILTAVILTFSTYYFYTKQAEVELLAARTEKLRLESQISQSESAKLEQAYEDNAANEASSKAENKDNLNQWGEDKAKICSDFAETRQACATAADFSQCMDIKDKHRSPYNPSIAMWSSDQYSCEVDGSIKKY